MAGIVLKLKLEMIIGYHSLKSPNNNSKDATQNIDINNNSIIPKINYKSTIIFIFI